MRPQCFRTGVAGALRRRTRAAAPTMSDRGAVFQRMLKAYSLLLEPQVTPDGQVAK